MAHQTRSIEKETLLTGFWHGSTIMDLMLQ
jgi:hypothetical protein